MVTFLVDISACLLFLALYEQQFAFAYSKLVLFLIKLLFWSQLFIFMECIPWNSLAHRWNASPYVKYKDTLTYYLLMLLISDLDIWLYISSSLNFNFNSSKVCLLSHGLVINWNAAKKKKTEN